MSDTGRYGDEDFDWLRERFMDMVRRHLSDCEPTPSKPKGKKKREKKVESKPAQTEIDGKPVEIARTGAGEAINLAADAMEWLILKDHLRSPVPHNLPLNERDRLLTISHSEADKRITTANDLATMFEKAELTPLRSPDFAATPGGGFGSRYVGVTKLRCMMAIQDLRSDIPPACMALLESVIVRNESPWHNVPKKQQQRIFQDIRVALDFATWSFDRARGKDGDIVMECKATVSLMTKWPEAREWINHRRLRAVTHSVKRDRKPD